MEHELKFAVDERLIPRVLAELQARCRPDPVHPAGRVTSVYFDTCDWVSVQEKRNSDYLKAKVRARWYTTREAPRPAGPVFLELKRREGSTRGKLRIETDFSAAEMAGLPLEDPRWLELSRLLEDVGESTRGDLLPAFELAYARRRFVEPVSGARVSLDLDIRVPRTNALRLPPGSRQPLPQAVLELKGSLDGLPAGLARLGELGLRRGSFSKYAQCFDRITLGRAA